MATASLGRLTLDLVARTAGFSEPLSQAERQAKNSGKGIAESMDLASLAVKGLGLAVGGLSVASMVAYSEKVINAGNDIQKFSKLANASVSQFQYYAKGAETAGISLESFADKMKDMQDRIGDFQQTGGGPLADFFTNIAPRVGITIQQFQKLSGPEALQLFYNSLEKAGASTNDMKFYMEAIISDSSLLIPLLEKNGQGFKFWGDAAQKTGAIMSNDMVKSLADAKVNLQLLDLQWQGLQATLINDAIPVIEAIAENWDKVEAGAAALATVIGVRLAAAFGLAGYQAAASLIQYTRYQVALARMAGETITLTTATRGLGGAMVGLLGGPLGIIALGAQVAIAGVTYYAMTRRSNEATIAFDEQGASLDGLIGKYKTLNTLQRDNETKALADQYDALKTKFVVASSGLSAFMEALPISDEKIATYTKLAQQYQSGKLSSDAYYASVKGLNDLSDEQLEKVRGLISAYSESKVKYDQVKEAQDALKRSTDQVSTSQRDQTKAVNDSAKAWLNLTQKQREYITQINRDVMRDNYIKALVGKGFSTEKANAFADAQVNANAEKAFQTALPKDVVGATLKGFNLKNYSFNKSELEAIAKVQGIAKANNFAQIEGLYGLPVGTLAALVLKESSGNANAISPTGAKGLFQTTSIFRKQYGLNSNSSVEAQATAAAQDIQKNIKSFGSLEKALMAYNAGAGGLQDYLAGGLSQGKRSEVAGYVPGFQKWFAGVNGKTAVDNSILMPTQADILAQQATAAQSMKELDDTRKQIDAQYYTESEKLAKDHQDRIEKITQAYTGTKELKTRLGQEDSLYKEQMVKLDVNRQQQLNQLQAFETDRITQAKRYYDEEIRLMQASTEYLGKDKELRVDLLKRARDEEIAQIQLEQDQQLLSAQSNYMSETEYAIKRYQVELREIEKIRDAKLRAGLLDANRMGQFQSLNQASDNVLQYGQNAAQNYYQNQDPQGFAKWSLQNQYSTEAGGLTGAYNDQVSGINLIQDEEQRNAQLLAAHEQYLQARSALDIKYADDEEKLRAAQLSMNLNYGEQIFGSMTDMLEASGDKQSGIYKAMFAANKAFAIAQSLVSIQQGIAQAAANPFPLNLAAMASVAAATAGIVSNISSVAGVFHGGTDYVPKEASYLLDKGERVLSPRQNSDLTNYLNGRQDTSTGGDIIINNNTSSNVSATRGADGKTYVTIDEVEKMVTGQLASPNSRISKAMQQNLNVARRR
ncbi:transglycosylase SLT domain-containing protein [Acinetobacter soli]|uniref:transglycosylase SLT domain-containing protein n=1 Tax=Acinetobacter soli TaxID=487316 RepID=UPI001D0A6B63|nr:transglycosylase SLT domain-containing protein [Acinetobacter soli]MCB8769348.1 transglycosylase SLT domain-containing protein [Acinetobacter soli]